MLRCRAVLLLLIACGLGVHDVAWAAGSPTPAEGSPYLVGAPRPRVSKAAPDTFALYGGPGSLLGKFQTATLQPDAQGWTPVDATQEPAYWRATLYNSPTGTMAYWCGATAEDEPSWIAPPGFGNSWNKAIEYRAQVSDPSQGQTVDLSFIFNYDNDTWDVFFVEYDSAGTWTTCAEFRGNNQDPPFTGVFVPVQYPDDVPEALPIVYAGNDYGGNGDEIVLRLHFTSDGAWSSEDGLFPNEGAVQIDDILVQHADGSSFEDFEGTEPFAWTPYSLEIYSGNFGHVMSQVWTTDPCARNSSPVLGFVDDGSGPFNAGYDGPGTGGSYSSSCLDVPDCSLPVFNYTRGVADQFAWGHSGGVDNEWWSPPIQWDLPGTADDDPAVRGCVARFSAWNNLPIENWIFYHWKLRTRDSSGGWTSWQDGPFVYYGEDPEWKQESIELGTFLPDDVDALQFALEGLHWDDLGSLDATQAPLFDNVSLQKYALGGPLVRTTSGDLARDAFPQTTSTDLSTIMARDLQDVRIDSHRDLLFASPSTVFGDSIVVEAHSLIAGTQPLDQNSQIRLYYSLNMNPVFEPAIRDNAPVTGAGTGLHGWDQHEGYVDAEPAATKPQGQPIELKPNFFAFDLPDADFMYPGDLLEYYIEVVDDLGNSSTLPADLTGFDDPTTPYVRDFTMHALPSYSGTDGSRPSILFWNASNFDSATASLVRRAFGEGGLHEGIHYDDYVGHDFGSGSDHAAMLAQLDSYQCIVIDSEDRRYSIMAASSYDPAIGDIGLLRAWRNEAGKDRAIVHFGDNLASWLDGMSSGQTYLNEIVRISVQDDDVSDELGGRHSFPTEPTWNVAGFSQDFVSYGGCPNVRTFDSIQPLFDALSSHTFDSFNPNAPSAGVYYTTVDGSGGEKQSLFFPYGISAIRSPVSKIDPGNPTLRSGVLQEIFAVLGTPIYSPPPGEPVPAPSRRSFTLHAAEPNPFNPSTTLSFTLGRAGRGSVKIYNARGELVRMLADRHFDAGHQRLVWQGLDDTGSRVASGVYLVQYQIDGFSSRQKIALVK